MKRKYFTVLLVAFLIVSLFTGCARKVSANETPAVVATQEKASVAPSEKKDGPVTITAWYTYANTNEANYKEAIRRFNESQDEYVVVGVSQAWNEINQKVMSALKAGNYPDIIAGEAPTISNYVREELVVDLLPYVQDPEIGIKDFDDFIPSVVSECTQWDGHMYMFPVSRTGEVFYYNKTFFDEHGLSVPTTWDELMTLSERIHEITGKAAVGFDFLDDSYIDMIIQNGGTYLDDENRTAGFLSEESRAAVEWFKTLSDKGCLRLKGEDRGLFIPFANELCYCFIGTSAVYKSIDGAVGDAFETACAPIPQGRSNPYVTMWGVNQAVFKSTPEREKGAYEFLKSFTQPDMNAQWAIGYNALPVRQSAIDSPAYQEFMQGSNPVIDVLVEQSDRYGYQPAVEGSFETNNAITIALDEILIGTETIDSGLEKAQKEADKALNR